MTTVMLKVLLIGKTGEGKSSTGNSLLNRKDAFEISPDTQSKTKHVVTNYISFKNYNMMVVDGPGLDDTAMTKADDRETYAWNLATSLAWCCDGVDAFILVIRFPIRFTTEVMAALDSMKKIFGDQFMSHVIVVVTFGDIFCRRFGNNPMNFIEWCKNQKDEAFRKLYNDCEGRFVLFNNREKDENRQETQMLKVFEFAHTLKINAGRYTSKFFEDAKMQRNVLLKELKDVQVISEFEEKIGSLTASIDKYYTNPEEGYREKIKAIVEDLKRELNQHPGILNNLRHLLKKTERDLYDVDSLHRLNRQLKQTMNLWNDLQSPDTVLGFLVNVALIPIYTLVLAYLRIDEDTLQEKINKIEKTRKHPH